MLAHELLQIVRTQAALVACARTVPTAETLRARPSAGGRAAGAVGIQDAGCGVFQEAIQLRGRLAVDTGRLSRRLQWAGLLQRRQELIGFARA